MAARKKTTRKKETRRERSARNKAAHAAARKEVPLGSTCIDDDFELPACPWKSGDGPTEEVVSIILETIASHPLGSLHAIHRRDPGYPTPGTWCNWLVADPELAKRYARARELQADAFAEQQALVTAGLHRKSGERDKQGAIQRDKLRAEGARWAASKLSTRYSDRVKLEHEGEVKLPVQVDVTKLSTEQLEQALALAEAAAVTEDDPA